jgi:RNA polymerase sigma-70 factor (ECF subfamily)
MQQGDKSHDRLAARSRRKQMTPTESAASATDLSTPTVKPDGSSGGFEELALPLLDSIHNFAHWLVQNQADAEDLVQETYLRALRGFARFEPGTNFRAWIFRILKNTFLSMRSSAHNRGTALFNSQEVLPELPTNSPGADSILIERARLDAIRIAIEQLPVSFREILLLCHVEEVSYRDIAHTLSIPMGTVMSRLARARKAVRESLLAPPPGRLARALPS